MTRIKRLTPAVLACLIAACGVDADRPGHDGEFDPLLSPPPMPKALSNNAVAQAQVDGTVRFYSFMGLGEGKTWLDISKRAFEYDLATGRWQELPPVPVTEGRLASVAASVDNRIHLFGGYTVAPDGHEVSTPEVLRLNPVERDYTAVAPMPTPVDDSVALVWRDRWVYLVSGWHMDANVALVQVYDSQADTWTLATPFPGAPVFGQAGALLGDTMLICDGVKLAVTGQTRVFGASSECWRGDIDPDDASVITWRRVASHPGAPRYRMAAAADTDNARLIFAGGSENPYNFDGIGYNGEPSSASSRVQAYLPDQDRWLDLPPLEKASMDHRGLLSHEGRHYLIGGMHDPQRVTAEVQVYAPVEPDR